jgi:MFS transporter, SET family, sugar efflux transporter
MTYSMTIKTNIKNNNILLCIILSAIGLQSSMISSVISYFIYDYLQFNGDSFSIIYAGYSLSCLIFGFLIPYMSDVIGRRKFFLCAVTLTSIASYIVIIIYGSPQASAASLIILLAPSASLTGLFFAYLRDLGWSASGAVAFRAIFSGAWVVGPVLSTYLIAVSSYKILFMFLLFISFLSFLLVLKTSTPKQYIKVEKNTHEEKGEVSYYAILLFVIFSTLRGANAISVMATPLIITKNLHESIKISGQLLGLCALLEIPMLFLTAKFLRVFNERTLIFAGCIIGLLYQCILVTTESVLYLFLAQILNATFISLLNGVGLVWFQNLLPTRTGLATGMYTSTLRVGALVGAPLASFIAVSMNNDFRYAGYVACMAFVLAFILLSLPMLGHSSRKV